MELADVASDLTEVLLTEQVASRPCRSPLQGSIGVGSLPPRLGVRVGSMLAGGVNQGTLSMTCTLQPWWMTWWCPVHKRMPLLRFVVPPWDHQWM